MLASIVPSLYQHQMRTGLLALSDIIKTSATYRHAAYSCWILVVWVEWQSPLEFTIEHKHSYMTTIDENAFLVCIHLQTDKNKTSV